MKKKESAVDNKPQTQVVLSASLLEKCSAVEKRNGFEELRRQVRLDRAKQAYTARRSDPAQGVSQEQYEQMLAEAGLAR
jgi:hypothetical protein